ncbi:MAG: DUF3500 domain-containing protein [Planctomycetes bacterium]|nr:DUF3500 domain-containing protein [Planctomycetota bacterium]
MEPVQQPRCPECEEFNRHQNEAADLNRRGFLGAVGLGALAGGLAPSLLRAADAPAATGSAKPAEGLIRELYGTLSDDQKKSLVYAWNHGADSGMPTRLKMVNAPHFGKRIGDSYTKAQQDLCHEILRAICSGEEGYHKISRGGRFDGSGSFEGLGAVIFGEPADDKQFSLVFAGHHLTIRCDGNSEPGTAFGGPMYYGHSAVGYSPGNVFFYQTKSVLSVYGALDEKQRKQAVVRGKTPGEQAASVRFRPTSEAHPGVAYSELSADQQKLVEQVMRDILLPYRKEDADEVMTLVKSNGGLEQMHLAFYADSDASEKEPWHFWRLEGPGFVWNYRVLPHVHTFVHIGKQPA